MNYSTDDTKNTNDFGDDSPAQWWNARQLADQFESPYGGCVRDNLGLYAWNRVTEAFLALTGDAPSNLATYDELMIVPPVWRPRKRTDRSPAPRSWPTPRITAWTIRM